MPISTKIFRIAIRSLLVSTLSSPTLHAADVHWVGDASDDWNVNTNWDPFGIPGDDDNAILTDTTFGTQVNVVANVDIQGLTIDNGIDLNTGGFKFIAAGGSAFPTNISGNGSTLSIPDAPGEVVAFFTHRFHLSGGGDIQLGDFGDPGAKVEIGLPGSTINDGSVLSGNGDIDFSNFGGTSTTEVLRNEGTIRANFGSLTLRTDGAFDLDGLSGNGVLDVDDGSFLSTSVTLVIAGPLTDPFDGTLQIGKDDTAIFFDSAQLGADGIGDALIEFDGDAGDAALATDPGETLSIRGNDTQVNVLSGTARFINELNIREATINVANNTALWFDDADIGANVSINLSGAYNMFVSGETIFRQAVVDWDGAVPSNHVTTINTGGLLSFQSDQIDVSRNQFDGQVVVNGGVLSVSTSTPWVLNGRIDLNHIVSMGRITGSAFVVGNGLDTGPDALIDVGAGGPTQINSEITFRSDAELQIAEGAELQLTNNSSFETGSEIKGFGTPSSSVAFGSLGALVNEGAMNIEHEVVIDAKLVNNDRLTVSESGLFSQLTVTEYDQNGAFSRLSLDIRSVESDLFDHLSVTGFATLGGVLDVDLVSPVEPLPGDQFPLITAEGVFGEFDSLQLPALADGNTWNVLYDPTAVILEVVSADLAGDYNDDGVVNSADYVVWRNHQGTSFDLPNRDPGLSGDVGQADYDYWKANFGNTLPEGSSAFETIPEPTTWASFAIAVLVLACGGRPHIRLACRRRADVR